MRKEYSELTIHQKMVTLTEEMVERELPLKEALVEFKKLYIDTAAKKYKGTKTRMAQALGIHRNTLHNLRKNLKSK